MNKVILRTLLICIAIPTVLTLMAMTTGGFRANEILPSFGIAFFIAAILYIIPAIILTIIESSRKVGQGMLLATGVLLLVGFSFCSTQPISFH